MKIKEIRLKSFGSILRNPKNEITLSLYLVAEKSPVIIPMSEKILLNNPLLRPSKAGIQIKARIIMSRVFKIYLYKAGLNAESFERCLL